MIQATHHEALQALFAQHFNTQATTIKALPPSGSPRLYFRLSDDQGHTAIGTYNHHVAENNTYFYLTELLRKHHIHVAEVYGISKDRKHYLQQDLGDQSLFALLQEKGHVPEVKQWYEAALEQLCKMQWIAGAEADFNQCYGTKAFDAQAIASDLMYFKYYFADLQHLVYDKQQVQEEMEELSKDLGRVQPQMLMFRDFRTRNIFIHEGKVWFIDFQGAMKGAPQYDIASLLWQAKAQLPDSWKEELLTHYISCLSQIGVRIDEIYFRKTYHQFVLLRMLQTLGAYGFRGLIERKSHFISSIAPALSQLASFLENYPNLPAYPDLRQLLEEVSHPNMLQKFLSPEPNTAAALQVEVCSFSYKNGYPKSESSHGGGFVFDCRGILNPGRIEAYKKLTGLDDAVKHYLQTQTTMPSFLDHAQQLVALTVSNYLERNFDSLSIAFGCTGGQHRSVFAAEAMAQYLRGRFGVPVTVTHTNSDNWVR